MILISHLDQFWFFLFLYHDDMFWHFNLGIGLKANNAIGICIESKNQYLQKQNSSYTYDPNT